MHNMWTEFRRFLRRLWGPSDSCRTDVDSIRRAVHISSILVVEREPIWLDNLKELAAAIEKLHSSIVALGAQLVNFEGTGGSPGKDSNKIARWDELLRKLDAIESYAKTDSGERREIGEAIIGLESAIESLTAKLVTQGSDKDAKRVISDYTGKSALIDEHSSQSGELLPAGNAGGQEAPSTLQNTKFFQELNEPDPLKKSIVEKWSAIRRDKVKLISQKYDAWKIMREELGVDERDFLVVDANFALIRAGDNSSMWWYVIFHPLNSATTNNTFMHMFSATPPIEENGNIYNYYLISPAKILGEAEFNPSVEKLDRVERREMGHVGKL
jgi:hypothetical protein